MIPTDPTSTPPLTPSGIQFEELRPPPIPDHELIRCIGRGSYGEVWLARNVMGTYRAVKIVHRSTFGDDRPFEREYNGIQRFEPVSRSHESQVDILHIGRHNGCFYYVMELADDQDRGQEIDPDHYKPRNLRTVIERQGRLTADETLEIALALVTALEHLHSHGLVHRDIKPSNIIFVHGIPKLADIGLVASVDATRSFVGTEGFLPPEGPGTPRADLYSLGKVLYELCTGRDRKDYPELPTLLDELEDRERLLELNAIVAKACREEAKDRYGSAEAMRQDLLLMQSGKSVRRMWALEKRLVFARQAGLVTGIFLLLAAGAYGYQARQTRIVEELAAHNLDLANESRELLIRLHVDHANRLVEEGDYSEALLRFTKVFELMPPDSEREQVHRIRLDSLLRNLPRVVQIFQHDAPVLACEFSPDGTRLASASTDRTARVWDVVSGEPVTPPLQHEDFVRSVKFSPDGRRVVTASADGTARVWDAITGHAASPPIEHPDGLISAVFSPDGTLVLTASADGRATLWDWVSGKALGPAMKNATGRPGLRAPSPSFSPDGRRVLTVNPDGTVSIWDVDRATPMFPPIDVGGGANFAVFSPDGAQVLLGTGREFIPPRAGIARVWDAATGSPTTPPLRHATGVRLGSFSPDGTRVVTAEEPIGEASSARIWDVETGAQIGMDLGPGSRIWRVVFSPDGLRIATAGESTTARIWDADTGRPLTPPLLHGTWVYDAQFSPDGYLLVTASVDGLVRIWDLVVENDGIETIPDEGLYSSHPRGAVDARFSADGRNLLASYFGHRVTSGVRLLDTKSWQPLLPSIARRHPSTLIAFSPDTTRIVLAPGKWYNTPGDTNALVLDATTGVELFSVAHDKTVRHAEFSRDARYLLTTSDDHTARVWDASAGVPVSHPLPHNARIWDASFSPDGNRVVTAGEDGTARAWDWASGDLAFPPLRVGSSVVEVRCVAYSPDGRRIATGDSQQWVRVWDALTGELLFEPIFHPGSVNGVAFSPDGTAIVSWSPAPYANVWSAETGERLLPPLRHQSEVTWVEFSPDGRYLVTGSTDTTARLWDATTGEAVSIPLQTGGQVYYARFHPDGTRIVTASNVGGARVWTFTPTKWPVEDLDRMADLLASHEVDSTLTRSVLPSDRIVAAFQELRARYPDDFRPSADRRIGWHRQHALQSMREQRWAAAAHHLTVLIAHHPEEVDLFWARGDALAELGQWERARHDFARQLQVKSGEDSDMRPRSEFLMVTLKLGEIDAARAHVVRWFEEATTTEDTAGRKSAGYWAACQPGLWPDYIGQAQWAEQNSTASPDLVVQYLRASRYEDVLQTFHEANLDVEANPMYGYYHAMALHRLGETTRSLESLAAADRKHDQYPELGPVVGHRWYDLAYADFARAEAHALIKPESVASLDP